MCLIEMGMPKMAPDRKPVIGADGKPEIAWIPRPQISCAQDVAEGMGVRTDSPMVEECRKGVMEFLLINHPLDCPICDQAGECRLQEFTVEYGNADSRFLEQKVKKPKNVELGPRVTLDDERCILCSRCIRFMQGGREGRRARLHRSRQLTRDRLPSGQAAREQLLAQHRRYLPGGRADLDGFPLQDARLVPQGDQEHLHQLRRPAATPSSARAKT